MSLKRGKREEETEYKKLLKYNLPSAVSAWAEKKYVWVQETDGAYSQAEILSETKDKVKVVTTAGNELEVKRDKIEPMNPPKFDGVEDCAELGHLNEPSVFHNLRKRYEADIIYTYSGLFLVAVNPYKRIPIYTPYFVDFFKGKRRNEVAPHVFAVSDFAYRLMLNERQNQSMLITGESGAGKTENTKKVIQYLAQIAGRVGGEGLLEQQLLEANPILESFGNAKTLKNDNSSRFGKFIRVQFNHSGQISGATIQSYLLEKSRVVFQAKGERNFHIFYQILAGASPEEKKLYHLDSPQSYKLFTGDCYTVSEMNDIEEFKHTKAAMTLMKSTNEELESTLRVVSAILRLSNIVFEKGYGDSATIQDKTHIDKVADLLRVNATTLENALVKPRIKAGTEVVTKQLDVEKANFNLEALEKALYGRLFLWISRRSTRLSLRRELLPSLVCSTLLVLKSSNSTALNSSASTTPTRDCSSSSTITCSSSSKRST
eukprot:TRINITY_DN3126_c0_g3_i1.p1 TRINITY_DN3126_c0_g3~~TRINITY_DN3126_c0_g3_i1.p1  ORF type:complete len:489 (+),score=158.81 TRINITY_DN3126_c0_g3_i1:53-1519(+)